MNDAGASARIVGAQGAVKAQGEANRAPRGPHYAIFFAAKLYALNKAPASGDAEDRLPAPIDTEEAARRLARVIVSDIQLYNGAQIASGEDISAQVKEGFHHFKGRVVQELHDVFDKVLAERGLAGGRAAPAKVTAAAPAAAPPASLPPPPDDSATPLALPVPRPSPSARRWDEGAEPERQTPRVLSVPPEVPVDVVEPVSAAPIGDRTPPAEAFIARPRPTPTTRPSIPTPRVQAPSDAASTNANASRRAKDPVTPPPVPMKAPRDQLTPPPVPLAAAPRAPGPPVVPLGSSSPPAPAAPAAVAVAPQSSLPTFKAAAPIVAAPLQSDVPTAPFPTAAPDGPAPNLKPPFPWIKLTLFVGVVAGAIAALIEYLKR